MTEIAIPNNSSAQAGAERPRRVWIAGLLALLVSPLLAYLYSGEPKRGVVRTLAATVTGLGLLRLSLHVPSSALRIGCMAAGVGAGLWLLYDATASATRAGTGYRLRAYNRWWVFLPLAVLLFFAGRLFFLAATRVVSRGWSIVSGAMEPTLLTGDFVFSAPLSRTPHRGEVVAYRMDGGSYISRVAGLGGDTLEMRDKQLFRNGRPVREPYVQHLSGVADSHADDMDWQLASLVDQGREGYRATRDHWGPLVVSPGTVFLLSDNRDHALDSRYLGLIPVDQIEYRIGWIYFSRDRGFDGDGIRWSRIGRAVE